MKVSEESVKTMNEAAIITFLAVDDDTVMEMHELCDKEGIEWIVHLNSLYEQFNPPREQNTKS